MRNFFFDTVAASSRVTATTYWTTWVTFHEKMFGADVAPLPLTVDSICAVAACFKEGGYRTYKAYLGKAREMHLLHGFDWEARLDIASRKSVWSVARGFGPARQSAPFDVPSVLAGVARGGFALGPWAPIGWRNLIVIGTFFIMREIEISLHICHLF